jgi:methanogenic corrinoid protein MtbC1
MAAPQHEFVASLLDRSAAAYANLAAQRLLGGHPEIARRYGAQAQAQWRFNLTQRVNEFAAAVELETPALFAEAVRWSRETFVARDLPGQDLRASLDALREVLLAELPGDCTGLIEATITPAFQALDEPPSTRPELDPQQPLQRLGLAYVEACLDGEPARATRLLLDAIENGLSIPDACLDVIAPSLAEVGRLWHIGRLGIHEEHAVMATTHRVLGLLAASVTHAPRNGKTVIGATVQGNAHDTAIRIITLLFEIEGWKSVGLGTELPPEEVANSVRDFDAHLAVLSATLIPQLRAVRRTIAAVRSASPETRILVGGQAFPPRQNSRAPWAPMFTSSARCGAWVRSWSVSRAPRGSSARFRPAPKSARASPLY